MFRLLAKVFWYVKYNLFDKWNFIYLEINLNDDIVSMPVVDPAVEIRKARREDLDDFRRDIFPMLTQAEANDVRYIERLGDDDFSCFIAVKNEKIIHYFLVFENSLASPLVKTPFDKALMRPIYSYLGTAFVVPEARGLWLVPSSLSMILKYLRDGVGSKKAYVLVHNDTPGAIDFYLKMGFNIV